MFVRKKFNIYSFVLLGLLVLIKALEFFGVFSFSVFMLPIVWVSLAFAVHFLLPQIHILGETRFKPTVIGYAFTGGIFFFAAQILVGSFLQVMGSSPYDLSPYGIFINVIAIVPMIFARESIRCYALATFIKWPKNSRMLMVVFTTFVVFLTEINWNTFTTLVDFETTFIFIVSDIFPLAVKNALFSVLALYGGAGAPFVYDLFVRLIVRIFPFLPTLPWIAKGALSIIFPLVLLVVVLERYKIYSGTQTRRRAENPIREAVLLGLAILFAWFTVGVFPIYPSVVLTGSMEPLIYPGDAILIKKIQEEEQIYSLAEGDVINFERDNINITHRIIEVIYDDAGNVSFRTKGDNNNAADSRIVEPNEVNGTIEGIVPKVGMLNLWMRSAQPAPDGVEN